MTRDAPAFGRQDGKPRSEFPGFRRSPRALLQPVERLGAGPGSPEEKHFLNVDAVGGSVGGQVKQYRLRRFTLARLEEAERRLAPLFSRQSAIRGPLFQQCGQLPARPAPFQRQLVKISDLSTFLKQCAQMRQGFARLSSLDQGLRQPGTNFGRGSLLEKAVGDHGGQPRFTVVAGDEEEVLKTRRIVQCGRLDKGNHLISPMRRGSQPCASPCHLAGGVGIRGREFGEVAISFERLIGVQEQQGKGSQRPRRDMIRSHDRAQFLGGGIPHIDFGEHVAQADPFFGRALRVRRRAQRPPLRQLALLALGRQFRREDRPCSMEPGADPRFEPIDGISMAGEEGGLGQHGQNRLRQIDEFGLSDFGQRQIRQTRAERQHDERLQLVRCDRLTPSRLPPGRPESRSPEAATPSASHEPCPAGSSPGAGGQATGRHRRRHCPDDCPMTSAEWRRDQTAASRRTCRRSR